MDRLAGFSLETWLAIGSGVLAVLSFLFNWVVVSRQSAREAETLRAARDADLIAWADDAIAALGDAQELLRERGRTLSADAFKVGHSKCRTRFTVLLDRGRLFFPGALADGEDDNRESAYRGRSHPALQALFDAYQVVTKTNRDNVEYTREDVMALVAARRRFVSEVFDAVDPRRRVAAIARLTR
ncbi:MAG: hypothetical protein JNJ73_17270 [Hyphomonadaceae bacterium]|nr:hypothetical protein [Hyphomonadaceae bacterium]